MTVYNAEDPNYLDVALKSIEEQTAIPNEIVLVEDGMLNEQLRKVIGKNKLRFKGRFEIIKLKRNRGRGYASQVGLKYISNEWVAKMDSDDISMPNRFELQLKFIEEHPDVQIVGGQIIEFEGNNIIGKRKVPLSYEKIKLYSQYRSPVNNPTVMMRKEAVLKVGGYRPINTMEDYDLYNRLLANGYKIMNLPEVLVKMRVNDNLYRRRGGIEYLFQYMKMKNSWRKMGIGSMKSMIISDFVMLCNVTIPSAIRKVFYQKFLHN